MVSVSSAISFPPLDRKPAPFRRPVSVFGYEKTTPANAGAVCSLFSALIVPAGPQPRQPSVF